ncbi:MAG: hypothetical protein ACYC3A_08705 [Halothiobacillus sp.]
MQIGVDCNLAVSNRRIFVIAQDEIARMALQFMLHDEYETHEFGSLDAAEAKARDWPPDLLIVGEDLLTGDEKQGAIERQFPQARLLVLANSQRDTRVYSEEFPANAQIHQPLRLEAVRAAVADRFL